jgi:hypothetical protein
MQYLTGKFRIKYSEKFRGLYHGTHGIVMIVKYGILGPVEHLARTREEEVNKNFW